MTCERMYETTMVCSLLCTVPACAQNGQFTTSPPRYLMCTIITLSRNRFRHCSLPNFVVFVDTFSRINASSRATTTKNSNGEYPKAVAKQLSITRVAPNTFFGHERQRVPPLTITSRLAGDRPCKILYTDTCMLHLHGALHRYFVHTIQYSTVLSKPRRLLGCGRRGWLSTELVIER